MRNRTRRKLAYAAVFGPTLVALFEFVVYLVAKDQGYPLEVLWQLPLFIMALVGVLVVGASIIVVMGKTFMAFEDWVERRWPDGGDE